jgi:hypothetical protein
LRLETVIQKNRYLQMFLYKSDQHYKLSSVSDMSISGWAQAVSRGETSGGAVAEGQSASDDEASSSSPMTVDLTDNTSFQRNDSPSYCYFCTRKLRLVDKYDCKCGEVFCGAHRHFKDHSCTYDYKASGRAAIAKANPTVKGSKLKKI